MSEGLKNCPLCGAAADTTYTNDELYAACNNEQDCYLARMWIPFDKWNHRPGESAARAAAIEEAAKLVHAAREKLDPDCVQVYDVLATHIRALASIPGGEEGGETT